MSSGDVQSRDGVIVFVNVSVREMSIDRSTTRRTYLKATTTAGMAGLTGLSASASAAQGGPVPMGSILPTTGGLNCADAELGLDGVQERFAGCFDGLFNRARLRRAERPQSRDENAEYPLPLPPKAGDQYGRAAVYNTQIRYDPASDTWRVTDDAFDTEQALYLANQDIRVGQWGGEFFRGCGVPGKSDEPPA